MTTSFPASVDTYTAKLDNVTVEAAADVNNLQDAMVAVETALFNLLNAGRGTLGYAQVVANQAGIAAQTDLTGLTVTVTVGAGRRLKISAEILVQSSVAGDVPVVTISEGGTVLQQAQVALQLSGTNYTLVIAVVLTPGAGSHTYKVTMARQVGTGSLTMAAAAAVPAFLLVQDIGV